MFRPFSTKSSFSDYSVPILTFSAGDLGSDCSSSADCTVTGSICSNGGCACSSELTEYNGKCMAGRCSEVIDYKKLVIIPVHFTFFD